jgi:hypothetical protein
MAERQLITQQINEAQRDFAAIGDGLVFIESHTPRPDGKRTWCAPRPTSFELSQPDSNLTPAK